MSMVFNLNISDPSIRIRNLIESLNYYTLKYDEGEPEITDKHWDELYFELKDLEDKYNIHFPDSPTNKINYQVVSELKKVKHNHPMLSLDKTKYKNTFLNYFKSINKNEEVIIMPKLDGLTCSLRYVDGKLVSAETRGNGEEGEDILHNALVISNIPTSIAYKEELIIDGEVICLYSDFKEFESEYKNPRNFAAGSLRLLDSSKCAKRKLSFIAWNVIKGFEEKNEFLYKLSRLKEYGFSIVPAYKHTTEKDFLEILDHVTEISKNYPIDGIVGRFNNLEFGESLGYTSHHPRSAYCFKFYDDEYETSLIDIEYETSRYGYLTPVAKFEPINTGDSIIEKASLHNLSIMKELLGEHPKKGQKVYVIKANDIIPQIVRSEINNKLTEEITIPKVCPICGSPTEIVTSENKTKKLSCTNVNCISKVTNHIDHYASKKGMNIKGLSTTTINRLNDWGWLSSIKDIYELKNHRDKWISESGFGEKSVDNILESIEESKNCTLSQFISAISIPLVGVNIAKEIEKNFKTWTEFREAVEDDSFNFYTIDGFGERMNDTIKNFKYNEADYIASHYLKFKSGDAQVTGNISATFCITGKLKHFKNRDELKSFIEKIGGRVSTSVSSKTNYLINNDINSNSSKNKSAKSLNIPIITEEEFLEKFGQN